MKGCLTCGVRQSGVELDNQSLVETYQRFIKTAKKAKDSKALLYIISTLTKRITVSVTSYDGEGNENGDLCIDPYITKQVTLLIAEAANVLRDIEFGKDDYTEGRW